MTPLWLPKLVAIVAGAFYVFGSEASRVSKAVFAVLVIASMVLQHGHGRSAWIGGLVLQTVLAVWALVYLRFGARTSPR